MGMGSIARRVGVVVLLGGALSAVALVAEASPGATATAFAGFGSSVTPGWNRPPTQTGAVRASNSAQTTFRVNPVRSGQSSARSYADLSTGALGVEALTDDPFGDSGATAQFRDVLTFKLPTNVNAVVIPLKFLVSGSVPKIQTPYGSPFGSATYALSITSSQLGPVFNTRANLYYNLFQPVVQVGHVTTFNASGVTGDFVAVRGVNYTIQATLMGRRLADFYHTATFSFPSLPPGVTFTSASGAFLGGGKTDGGVPEPASWALMLAGFFSLGAMLRARRARVGPPIH